ncbi:hypothetical protein QAD02_009145 [Eretmocerus hayati]|uniref:Uncharacterized protein n=1 Tax=Eretmocerus hayati TaxID=131215 RepID=A0ACC2NAV8_9HYME|nr:hypothetical protein QAD02_009145 [Eretmocerus hayati]
MEPKKRSLVKVKKKMTREQMQMAIIKKRECDAKALAIVEQLLEPQIDPAWLTQNLKNINRCHMEDVIEERAITKLCGYVLCQKPLTIVINQQYHISLKDKKVYDVSKRKNFCSSSCFGASNYLLEQMLTSPLWLRDKEEIPDFQIFSKEVLKSNKSHGEEVDITIMEPCVKNEECKKRKTETSAEKPVDNNKTKHEREEDLTENSNKTGVSGCVENFVFETFKHININDHNTEVNNDEKINPEEHDCEQSNKKSGFTRNKTNDQNESTLNQSRESASQFVVNDSKSKESATISSRSTAVEDKSVAMSIKHLSESFAQQEQSEKLSSGAHTLSNALERSGKLDEIVKENSNICNQEETSSFSQTVIGKADDEKSNIISSHDSQTKFVHEKRLDERSSESLLETSEQKCNTETPIPISANTKRKHSKSHRETPSVSKNSSFNKNSDNVEIQEDENSKHQAKTQAKKLKRTKTEWRKKTSEAYNENLAFKVEQSFQEWVGEETIHFLFGDDTVKKKAIEKIQHQDRYSILCEKLNRLQFEDEQDDAQVLEKPSLKPAPHFEVLKEEGQKLDLKVRAFFQGKTTFERPENTVSEQNDADADTFLPLTDVHAPQTLRRKIFLDRLDQVLPDLLRTLAGNNEVYARASCNYTSVRCTAVKALVHTFSLSAKNIIFKSAEWTLVGLVIIKMLSLLDPWLATLLMTKQANMYTSMILTSYKLNPDYLSLFVSSFNPEMNPR